MRRILTLLLLAALLLGLAACGRGGKEEAPLPPAPDAEAALPEEDGQDSQIIIETAPPAENGEEPSPPAEVPAPEEAYTGPVLPEGCTAQDAADYFCEVALSSEYTYSENGDDYLLKKWADPIYYGVYGQYTEEDLQILDGFLKRLNSIEGFPGMYPAEDPSQENFTIRFLSDPELAAEAGFFVNGENVDGAATWDYYIDTSMLYRARVWISSDSGQALRNSVIQEEIFNSLGLFNDSYLRPDSIIYQYYSEPQAPSPVDWLLMELLYSENLKRGMDESRCREAILAMFQ